jgi:hypothetical protein
MADQELVNASEAQKNAGKSLDDLASFLSSLRVNMHPYVGNQRVSFLFRTARFQALPPARTYR